MFKLEKKGIVDEIGGDGPLDTDAVEELSLLLDQVISNGPPRLVFDLTQVPFIHSTGLEWLLDAHGRCTTLGGRLKLASANPLCRDILRITAVDHQLATFDELIGAVGSFTR